MGLKSNFGTIRSNILNEKSWSNVNEAYFKIIQEEQVQKMIRGEEHGDTVAYAIRNNNTTNRSKLFCSVCNKTGHESKDCFTIIGYLDWQPEAGKLGRGTSSCSGGRGNRGRENGTGDRGGFGWGDNPNSCSNSSFIANTITIPIMNSMNVLDESGSAAMHVEVTNSKNPPPGLFTEDQ